MKVNVVFLTGAMRSGTSALGKIIGSLDGVEFFYEPMIFVNLLLNPSGHEMLNDYVYSDLLMPALAGRNINLNVNDDSSIYNYKTEAFVEARMARSWPADVIHDTYPSVSCLIKYPTYVAQIGALKPLAFPAKKVYICREPNGNIHSLLRKRWFSDEVMTGGIRGEFRQVGGRNVPLWIEDSEVDTFFALDELGRCLFYYNKVLSADLSGFDVIISYEALCNDPFPTAANLQKKLDLMPGGKTEELLAGMRPEKVPTLDISSHNAAAYEAAMANYGRVKSLANV